MTTRTTWCGSSADRPINSASPKRSETQRVRHLVTNVRIADGEPGASELDAKSNFLVYRNRVDDETDVFVGERRDRLRRVDGGWQIAKRVVLLDQSTLLAKNLTLFF